MFWSPEWIFPVHPSVRAFFSARSEEGYGGVFVSGPGAGRTGGGERSDAGHITSKAKYPNSLMYHLIYCPGHIQIQSWSKHGPDCSIQRGLKERFVARPWKRVCPVFASSTVTSAFFILQPTVVPVLLLFLIIFLLLTPVESSRHQSLTLVRAVKNKYLFTPSVCPLFLSKYWGYKKILIVPNTHLSILDYIFWMKRMNDWLKTHQRIPTFKNLIKISCKIP